MSNVKMKFVMGKCPCHPFTLWVCFVLLEISIMGSGPIDPKELLKGLDSFLNRDGEVKSVDGISKIFR